MKERPILFSAPMVRANIDGSKTQTRRIVKLPHENPLGRWEATTIGGGGIFDAKGNKVPHQGAIWHTRTGEVIACPYGQPGDRLWVRETWRITTETVEEARALTEDIASGSAVDWRATYIERCTKLLGFSREDAEMADGFERWRPSIHMPRWASRITLEITGVRVERLQDISEADAAAEGVDCIKASTPTNRDAYRYLWEDINGLRSWDANPWVWIVEFLPIANQPVEE